MTSSNEGLVRNLVVVLLDGKKLAKEPITADLIRDLVQDVADKYGKDSDGQPVDVDRLSRDIETDYNVHVGNWNALADDGDHVAWLPQRHDDINWRLWNRYARYLSTTNRMARASRERLDEITTDVLGRLEDPERPGGWDRRGLVAGQVQSGKTGNYIGLICKALDAGYKLVVVLAGVHNSLRSQTQSRVDEGILGFDTRKNLRYDQADADKFVGVGRLAGQLLHVNSFTSSKQTGDFSRRVAENIGVAVGGHDPIVLVVKKNKSILTNLHEWATELRSEIDPDSGRSILRDVPVLVIDDEADHASIDTNGTKRGDEEHNPSVINRLIRKFVRTFEQSAYVAYTATPFANIFIDPDAVHGEAGEDVFPKSFIVNLPAPSTYVGPARVFGLREDIGTSIDAVEALPIVRPVRDYDAWMPDKHKSSHVPPRPLPESLRAAILSFLIAGAIRNARGQGDRHHSMLIHVTRFTAVQRIVTEQVQAELDDVRSRLMYGEGADPIVQERVAELYRADYRPTHREIGRMPDLADQTGPLPSLDELLGLLPEIAQRTHIRTINGQSQDAFEYIDHPEGVSVIAVGGDKLSRGLTLEGLSMSYYLRSTRMYDTLMQMGRWFGYRPGYLDVCRLYTTPELQAWYASITAASEELLREFDYMAAANRTPRDFGLRVVQHPDGLLVTSPSKLRHARRISISFAGAISETIIFDRSAAIRERNWSALEAMLNRLDETACRPDPREPDGDFVWHGVPADIVTALLATYEAHPAALKAQPKALREYIRARAADHPPELTTWTVVVANKTRAESTHPVAGRALGLIERAAFGAAQKDRYSIRRLVSPAHERIDLDPRSDAWREAMSRTIGAWEQNTRKDRSPTPPTEPAGRAVRSVRSAELGLLIIYPLDPKQAGGLLEGDTPFVGLALSFPASGRAKPIEYQVNPVFWEQEFARYDEIPDEDGPG
jgi:hypothetical protein